MQLSIKGVKVKTALLDRGSTVSLMNEETYRKIGRVRIMVLEPFNLLMADQSGGHTLGVLPELLKLIRGIKYLIDVVVLRRQDSSKG